MLFKRRKNAEEQAAKKTLEIFQAGLLSVRDLISPSAFVVSNDHLKLNDRYVRSFFVLTYPQYIETNWLSPVINYDVNLDISMYIYPIESDQIMRVLRRKVTEMESSLRINEEKQAVRDPELEIAYQDAEELRDKAESRLDSLRGRAENLAGEAADRARTATGA